MKNESMTDEQIKELALALFKGSVFTDRHIDNQEDISRVFMPLVFIKQETIDEWKVNPPGMLYEYISEASPRSINGMPMFFSVRIVSVPDTKKVLEVYNKIKGAVDNISCGENKEVDYET